MQMSFYQKTALGYVLKAESNKFLQAIYSREHKGINSIILILGPRGIGKTYLAMAMAIAIAVAMAMAIAFFKSKAFASIGKGCGNGFEQRRWLWRWL